MPKAHTSVSFEWQGFAIESSRSSGANHLIEPSKPEDENESDESLEVLMAREMPKSQIKGWLVEEIKTFSFIIVLLVLKESLGVLRNNRHSQLSRHRGWCPSCASTLGPSQFQGSTCTRIIRLARHSIVQSFTSRETLYSGLACTYLSALPFSIHSETNENWHRWSLLMNP